MIKSWRPEGWKEIVKENVSRTGGFFDPVTPFILEDDRLLFEAGADAILEALRKTGIDVPVGVIRVSNGESAWLLKRYAPYGKVVYIPDDKEVK